MIITFKCYISIYSILVIFSFQVSLRNLLPAGSPHVQNLAIIVDSEFLFLIWPHFWPYTRLATNHLVLCFTESQIQLPPNGTHHTLLYILWNPRSSINCLFFTLRTIGHKVLSITLPNFILRTFELCFSVLIQILRVPYLDHCNHQADFPFSSLILAMTFYSCFLDRSSQLSL